MPGDVLAAAESTDVFYKHPEDEAPTRSQLGDIMTSVFCAGRSEKCDPPPPLHCASALCLLVCSVAHERAGAGE